MRRKKNSDKKMKSNDVVSVSKTGEDFDPSLTFINDQVINAGVTSFGGGAKLLADQAAAMMVQDIRSFMQGSQQVYMLATAKAISKTLSNNPVDQKTGGFALEKIAETQMNLVKFASEVGTTASTITNNFHSDDASSSNATKDFFQAADIVEDAEEEDTPNENNFK